MTTYPNQTTSAWPLRPMKGYAFVRPASHMGLPRLGGMYSTIRATRAWGQLGDRPSSPPGGPTSPGAPMAPTFGPMDTEEPPTVQPPPPPPPPPVPPLPPAPPPSTGYLGPPFAGTDILPYASEPPSRRREPPPDEMPERETWWTPPPASPPPVLVPASQRETLTRAEFDAFVSAELDRQQALEDAVARQQAARAPAYAARGVPVLASPSSGWPIWVWLALGTAAAGGAYWWYTRKPRRQTQG